MRNENLTRHEAAGRSQLLQVRDYDVLLDLSAAEDASAETFGSTTTVRFAAEDVTAGRLAPTVRRVLGPHWVPAPVRRVFRHPVLDRLLPV